MNDELDCRGLQCPQPVIRCRSLLTESNPAALSVLVDNAAAVENVSRFLERNGYAVATAKIAEKEWRVGASKTGDATTPQPEPATGPSGGKTLVLLTTETLGLGDDDLGARLMEMFLANLSELGDSLWRVILLNGAVKLSAREGAALGSLKKLAAAGVDVLVCGTCLTYYGLLEQKKVGATTNMMDVITSLALAQKVIRP